MFNNIGKKIKILAQVVFIIEATAAILGAFILMSISEYLVGPGLILLLVGPFVAWISSWFAYGFGELIDKTSDIELNTRFLRSNMTNNGGFDPYNAGGNDRLNRLERLRANGVITEEEYRRALMNQQPAPYQPQPFGAQPFNQPPVQQPEPFQPMNQPQQPPIE